MAVQTLTPVQISLVNDVVRPAIERIVGFHAYLDGLVLELDNQQDPIAVGLDELGDGVGGTAPRADAPLLIGDDITSLRNFAANMRTQISGGALNQLITKMVRDVNVVRSQFGA